MKVESTGVQTETSETLDNNPPAFTFIWNIELVNKWKLIKSVRSKSFSVIVYKTLQ